MSTTAITLEYVVIGFQVLVWCTLALLTCAGHEWIRIDQLKDWTTPLSFLAIGAAYTLGVLFDRIASIAYSFMEQSIWPLGPSVYARLFADNPSPVEMRMTLLTTHPDAYKIVDQQQRRTWLLRSSLLNLCLVTLLAALYATIRHNVSWWVLAPAAAVAIALAAMTTLALRSAAIISMHELVAAYKACMAHRDSTTNRRPA